MNEHVPRMSGAERKELAAAMMPHEGDTVTLAQIVSVTAAVERMLEARLAATPNPYGIAASS